MNASSNITDLDTILCPLDSRRTVTELWVKLAVVHFTVIAAFCHLLSIRGEPILSWKLVYYLLTPLILLMQHALALLFLLLAAIIWLIRPIPHRRTALYQAAKWFYGKVPTERGQEYAGIPMSEIRADTVVPGGSQSKTQSIAKRAGQIIIAGAFLTQCVGTIYIYRRRLNHGAVTKSDQRVYELGCSGIVTAIVTILTIAKIPLFDKPVPDIPEENLTALDKAVVQLRDTVAQPFLGKTTEGAHGLSFLKNGMIAFVLVLVTNNFKLFRALKALLAPEFWHSRPNENPYSDVTMEIIFLGLAFIMGCVVALFGICPGGTPRSKVFPSRILTDDRPWWFCFLAIFAPAVIWIPVLFFAGFIPAITFSVAEFSTIHEEITLLGEWPTNTACPQLWTDPLANWVWMLA
ncbi:hypothetical protein F5882DRAFT_413867 [Hyaloscypha sp. PMI_1271]|nr:hypothetical protein F5882DRAFT_413867 [Hyaloscypha sp. PMI_1271]